MPRQDLDNRDRDGQFQNRYSEPLSTKKIGVYLFESDDDRVRAIAQKLGMSATEVVRYLIKNSLANKDKVMSEYQENFINIQLQNLEEEINREIERQRLLAANLMQDEQVQKELLNRLTSRFKNHRKNADTANLVAEEVANFLSEKVKEASKNK